MDLDEEYARRAFAGKSLEAAVEMFAENVLMRSELVERKLQTEPDWIAPIMPELLHVVSLIETSGDRYGPDKDIYGDYGEQAQRVRTAWDAHRGRRS